MSGLPYKYVQTVVSIEEAQEIDNYFYQNKSKLKAEGIHSKREWLREIIMREVRGDGEPLPLH